ncbi:hypothetical protein CWI36_0108p0010 [Hamiltosporidium magnivora]|uniref:Uncharacterized protein n=1 Tax=Hamiltosporidium magnivora TaxID=148818 RepID=A0A4V6MVI6_9MICR|nr:hypothetical protein CWI36_0108p0010 [Hamiltosporidium magnivora]
MLLFICKFSKCFIGFINSATVSKEDNSLSVYNDQTVNSNYMTSVNARGSSECEFIKRKTKRDKLNHIIDLINKKRRLEISRQKSEWNIFNKVSPENTSSNDNSIYTFCSHKIDQLNMKTKTDTGILIDTTTSVHNESTNSLSKYKSNEETKKHRVPNLEEYHGTKYSCDAVSTSNQFPNEIKIPSSYSTAEQQSIHEQINFDSKKYFLDHINTFETLCLPTSRYRNQSDELNIKAKIKGFIQNIKAFLNNIDEELPNKVHVNNTNHILNDENISDMLKEEKLFLKTSFRSDVLRDIDRMFSFALKLVEYERNNKIKLQGAYLSSFINKNGFMNVLDKLKTCAEIYFLHELIAIKNIYNTGFEQNIQDGYILYTCFLFDVLFTRVETILSNMKDPTIKMSAGTKTHNRAYKQRIPILNLDIEIFFLKSIFMRILYGCKDGKNVGKIYALILLTEFRFKIYDFNNKSLKYYIPGITKLIIVYTNMIRSIKPSQSLENFTGKMLLFFRDNKVPEINLLDLDKFLVNEALEEIIDFFFQLIKEVQAEYKIRKKYKCRVNTMRIKYKWCMDIIDSNNKNIKDKKLLLNFLVFYYSQVRSFLCPKYQFEIYISYYSWNIRMNEFNNKFKYIN